MQPILVFQLKSNAEFDVYMSSIAIFIKIKHCFAQIFNDDPLLLKNYRKHKQSSNIFKCFSRRNSGNNYPTVSRTMSSKGHFYFLLVSLLKKYHKKFSRQNISGQVSHVKYIHESLFCFLFCLCYYFDGKSVPAKFKTQSSKCC